MNHIRAHKWNIASALIALFMINIPFVVVHSLSVSGATWIGLDDSWPISLNYFLNKHAVWGRDVVFTYGPLAFLSTRCGLGISQWLFLLFDLFMVANFYLLFSHFIRNAVNKPLALLIVVGTALMLSPSLGSDTAWVLMLFSYFWMYRSFEDPRYSHFIIAAILITLSFYIKLNTGFICILLFFAHVGNLLVFHKINFVKAAVVIVIPIALICTLAIPLHVSLGAYIKGSLEMIRGYNDIMYLQQDNLQLERIVITLYYAMLAVFICYAVLLVRRRQFASLFFIVISILYITLFRKQSLHRNDIQHLYEFFFFGPFELIYGNLLGNKERSQQTYLVVILMLVLFPVFLNAEHKVGTTVFNRLYTPVEYLRQLKEYDQTQYLAQKDKRYLPQRVLDRVGNGTVDIFPWDTEYLLENKLNYSPRPVFQSDAAFTGYLEKLNYDHFVKQAPQFLIYDYDAIDERYPFNEESLVNLFILKNYSVSDTFFSNGRWQLLLTKQTTAQPVRFVRIKEEQVATGQEIAVDNFDFVKIDTRHNLRGAIGAAWSKPSRVIIKYQDSKDVSHYYKTSGEMLRTGLAVKEFIADNRDFATAISRPGMLPRIRKIQVCVDTNFFTSQMQVTYFRTY